jgi:5'-3' exonuclease
MGDKSDNIPSICRGVGPVRAAKIVDGDMNSFLNENENYKRIYELNKALIDFDFIPVDIKHSILKKYDTYELREYNGMKLWGFLCKNKLEKLADDLNIIGRFLKKITKNG